MESGDEHILKLVEDLRNGVPTAAAELLPLVYEDLRKLAATMLGRERASHTLQATALVNEACVKLMGGKAQTWNGQDHFLAVAAMAMRQVLVSHARAKHAAKRGGDGERLTLLDPVDSRGLPESCVEVLALEEALAALEKEEPQLARIIELRYFAGMSIEQVARVMGMSDRTVNRLWRVARADLATRLGAQGDSQ